MNCDEDENKAFCGGFGVQGFPTLKIVKPGKKYGKPIIEDYQGAREAKDITEAVMSKIPNHVKKLTDKDMEAFLKEGNDTAKAILFTEKGTTSALLKAVAIDFLGSITVGQIRSKEKTSVEEFGVTKFPTIVLLPGGDAEGIVYNGEMKKAGIVQFLTQVAEPNPDPAPAKVTMPKKKKEDKKAKEDFEKASVSHAKSEATEAVPTAADETLEQNTPPTESPKPIVDTDRPVEIPTSPPIPALSTTSDLAHKCLDIKSGTCILAFIPEEPNEMSAQGVDALADIAHKYLASKRTIFPFYAVPATNDGASPMKTILSLPDHAIIAINRKRGWYRQFKGADYSAQEVENWIDAIRMGEGEKQKLPGDIFVDEKIFAPQEAAGAEGAEPQTTTIEQTSTVTQKIAEVTPDVDMPEPAATPDRQPVGDEIEVEPAEPEPAHDEL